MSKLRRIAAVLLLLAAAAPAAHAGPSAPDPTYAAVRGARPDGRRIPVRDLVLERDAFRFQFDSGEIHFLAPVDGRTFGAVFVGQGSYRLTPATRNERRHLALVSGGDADFEVLSDSFDDLLLLFADDTAAELQLHAPVETGAPDPRAARVVEQWLERQRKDFRTNFHLRVVRDLVNSPNVTSGAFLALVKGKKHPAALAAVDPDGADALGFGGRLGGEDALFFVADQNRGGFWYHCDRQGEVKRGKALPVKQLADALDYRIETEIARDTDVKGTATIRFQTLVPNLRFVPLYLLPELRISEAAYALDSPEAAGAEPAWKPVAFVQEAEKEDGDAAVVFPEPLAKGATVLLRVSYAGDKVLRDGGDKNYYVGARASWYPNLGIFSDMAGFDLVYRVPAGNEVISVGRKLEERTEGRQVVTRWKTDAAAQVAGFNYGRFKKLEKLDDTSGLTVQVFTNPGTPDIIREINDILSGGPSRFDTDVESAGGGGGPGLGTINTGRLAEAALADGLNSARLFATWFGPIPHKHVAITQQSEGFFGQSWPTLIFMPYISFLDGTQRQRLGLARAKDFVDQVGYHEFAHQWWGHLVGAATYRDQWLEEGFSEFSAALAVQHVQGWPAYEKFWRDTRKNILDKYPGNDRPHWQAGPISQGYRLYTQRTPSAGQALIYSKGGYVLHMLRLMMREPAAPNPDARFIAMMKDFTATYGGKLATTADFKKVVERHMTGSLNATGDGRMDWFFDQWVHGTEIPRYVADLEVEKGDGDKWRIRGQIRQEGVGEGFRALVPLQVEFSKNETATVGLVPMAGEVSVPVDVQLALPKKPRKALVNAHGEVLARE